MNKNFDPRQFVMQNINNVNPIMGNLIQLAQKGDYKSVENFARNLYQERGGDFDKDFTSFMNNFKK